MATTKIRGNTQIIDGTIENAQIASSAAIASSKLADGANFIKKDGSVAFTADQSAGGNKITNVGTPTSANDAANKAYVDSVTNARQWKDAVRVATTANITLSGTQTIDGVSLSSGDRVLVKDQSTAANNGIYIVSGGSWSRSEDANSSAEVLSGTTVNVNEGTAQGNTRWVLTTDGTITLGSTSLTFQQDSTGETYTAGDGLSLSGNSFSVMVAPDTGLGVGGGGLYISPADASIQLDSSGVRVALHDSSIISDSSGLKINTDIFISREVPTGLVNSSNTTYTLLNTPVSGSEHIYLNGLLQEGGSEDYSISGDTITMVSAPITGDRIRVSYIASPS